MKFKDLTGNKFGKWTVVRKDDSHHKRTKWLCLCKCGGEKSVYACHLISGKSNGCLDCAFKTHGMTESPEFSSWTAMKLRCLNKNHVAYHRYGGRGIKICERWLGKEGFNNFFNDMGRREKGMSLDRINADGNYEPSNCKWSTNKEQSNNTYTNLEIHYKGKKYSLANLAKLLGINYNTIFSRYQRGTQLDSPVLYKNSKEC